MERGEFDLSRWRQAVSQNFKVAQERYTDFDSTRELELYQENLPRFKERVFARDFVHFIGRIINQKGRAVILDVGCGQGVALTDLKGRFGLRVVTWGVSASDFRSRYKTFKVDRYLVGDIHEVRLPRDQFDVIVSYQSFQDFADPLLVLARCWRWLRPGGYGFIDSLVTRDLLIYRGSNRISNDSFMKLLRLRFRGDAAVAKDLDDGSWAVAFRKDKSRPRLTLPVRYQGLAYARGVWRASYDWTGDVPEIIERKIYEENQFRPSPAGIPSPIS